MVIAFDPLRKVTFGKNVVCDERGRDNPVVYIPILFGNNDYNGFYNYNAVFYKDRLTGKTKMLPYLVATGSESLGDGRDVHVSIDLTEGQQEDILKTLTRDRVNIDGYLNDLVSHVKKVYGVSL